jgi:hypothetical protein
MMTITAIIRNGRIEVAEPINLPDGTVLTIPVPAAGASSDQSESAADWIRWYDALEPLEFTSDEWHDWQAAREAA